MKVSYKSKATEHAIKAVNLLAGVAIAGTFVLLYGLETIPEPFSARSLHIIQIVAFLVLLAEKTIRFVNAYSKMEYLRVNWFEIPLLAMLMFMVFAAGQMFATETPGWAVMLALNIYLVAQVVVKLARSSIDIAATGQNPMGALVLIFVILIVTGAGMLMLPRAHNLPDGMRFIDALFTSTSATCVTGLIVLDTGNDFSLLGQVVILSLIQLGGLGIVTFGAVMALLLGQALSVRESVAMQDLLNAQTLGRIGTMIGFIFITTMIIEAIGAIALYGMWFDIPGELPDENKQWFCSIFHSISAFCNAGFSLFPNSLINYRGNWRVYGVIAPLIVMGGLGFGVLYNLFTVAADRLKRFVIAHRYVRGLFTGSTPQKVGLQTKIVLMMSLVLIVGGAVTIGLFESLTPVEQPTDAPSAAIFQSITARTAGFNTVDVATLSEPSKLMLIVLMFIGGSPGSTAGGIKTVTFAVIIMIVFASMRKRSEVELFNRSVPMVIVGRAITVAVIFGGILLLITFALTITERQSHVPLLDLFFEATSALATVGLSTGITGALTTPGKLIIIAAMLIGRLGPLSLLAALTYNIRPTPYDYPREPVIVG